MMSYLYAIRHSPTGRYLPHERGGTFAEPVLPDAKTPRFFRRERDAKGFLTVWLGGPLRRTFTTDWETGGEDYEGLEPDPRLAKEPRIRDEWEVVTIYWGVMDDAGCSEIRAEEGEEAKPSSPSPA